MNPLDPDFLAILRCPASGAALREMDADQVASLNQLIQSGTVFNRVGQRAERSWDAGLVTVDGPWAYPVYDDIPQLIADESVSLDVLRKDSTPTADEPGATAPGATTPGDATTTDQRGEAQ